MQKKNKSTVPSSKRSQHSETPAIRFNRTKWLVGIAGIMLLVFILNVSLILFIQHLRQPSKSEVTHTKDSYWFLLHRKSQKEYLYKGVPGDPLASTLIKIFRVKTGIPGERPTPLPEKVGREYWIITEEHQQFDNPETAPYFLTLNVPVGEEEPFGPVPYTECGGQQCNWILPGAFGLHGTASDSSKLSEENPGSSGCIRHTDEDITFLYTLLDPNKEEIRYYIEDI